MKEYEIRVSRIDPDTNLSDYNVTTSYKIIAQNHVDAEIEAINRYKDEFGGTSPNYYKWPTHVLGSREQLKR